MSLDPRNKCIYLTTILYSPPVKLSEMASQKSPPATPPPGIQLTAFKIMRRKSPSQKGIDGESDQTGDGRSGGTQANDLLKLMTREEKEAAYQLARARIFGDFKESPSDSPSPSKSEFVLMSIFLYVNMVNRFE